MHSKSKGVITMLSVLTIGAISLAVALTVLLTGISWSQSTLAFSQGIKARALAESCAEYALIQLKASTSYPGNKTLILSTGSCTIRPVLGSGNTNRTVETIGNAGPAMKKIRVGLSQINPQILLTSWDEVADF